jgi:hypothetical protein
MKRNRNLIILLILTSAIRLLADDNLTLPPDQIPISSAPGDTKAAAVRFITEREFNGTDPIIIAVNETLIVPVHYKRFLVANNIQVHLGPEDPTVLDVTSADVQWSQQGMILDLKMIWTGLKVGETKIKFGEEGYLIKEFNIHVVE